MLKKLLLASVSVILAFGVASCKGEASNPGESPQPSETETKKDEDLYTANEEFADSQYEQLKPPQPGEEIVVISTSMGDIKVRLFPELAPKAVENFKGLANKKYYENSIFHRVIKGFVIQGGDPLKNGTGGESIWGGKFEVEITPELHHIRGALAMARAQSKDSQGSQFYIVQNDNISDKATRDGLQELLDTQEEIYYEDEEQTLRIKDVMPKEFVESYLKNGGTYSLDFQYTVFGQVFSGMSVVDAIADLETVSEKPVEDVVILSVTVEKYE